MSRIVQIQAENLNNTRGALENATKQLDHVIDQARHKHSQHRNKFKEAIDYLDQIFEDLKKECDTVSAYVKVGSIERTTIIYALTRLVDHDGERVLQ
ncbi:unnamed protein product [Nippostrongylus brasiliensis]|uniref:MIT domain-containing protein n=1 Tax=Nippostrongylus brasiliensis TaxID=27835 RepID=A0A0N4XLZ1_NIPBR|nr:unnamed protein product [Nippostrongylus brasiliensis]